ncbi:hypothetical protein EBR96_03640 [bacterium]|nr:hypothetical protein [bacterium]
MNRILSALVAGSVFLGGAHIAAQSVVPSAQSPGGLSITALDRLAKTTSFGGYFDVEWKSSGKENSFVAHRLVLQTSAQPHPAILFNTELEYEYGGAVNDLGDTGKIKLEQAWVDYRISDLATARAGIVLVPFGRLNYLHDSDARDTTNRSMLHRYVIPTTWSDTGVGLRGGLDINSVDVTYEAYLLNGLVSTATATNGIRDSRPGFKSDNNGAKAFATRVAVLPSVQNEIGFSFYNDMVKGSSGEQSLQMYGIDVLHKMGAFELAAEAALSRFDASNADKTAQQQDGYMIEARYRWMPDWIMPFIGANQFSNPNMTWFARVGQVELNRGGGAAKGQSQTTIGFNYRPIQTFVYKLEYEMNQGNLSEGDYNVIWSSVAVGF